MQRIATWAGEWSCARNEGEYQERVAAKVLGTVLGIIKDCLVMSVVIMAGAALTLLSG